jgi:uncharacterized protein YdeI (YjbR/CyaY-like superfamily)
MRPSEPIYFPSPAAFRKWLTAHHETERELLVGFHKKATGAPSMTWPESVAEALCAGWIDGVRRRVDDDRYTIRFTPRKPGSTWSAINIRLMEKLIAEGRVLPAGLAAFARRKESRSGIYSYEQRAQSELDPDEVRRFRASRKAWKWFEAAPPGYRKTAIWRVVSAKRADTRARRLEELIACSALGKRIPSLSRDRWAGGKSG